MTAADRELRRLSDPFDRALGALEERGPGRMVPDLERITELAALLGDPQQAYPSVHVTGTNGKGSVVRMVASLCAAAGIDAGTFTSPHLQTVRERIGVGGRPSSPERFAAAVTEVATLADLVDAERVRREGSTADRVTYFELLTAAAYWAFAEAPVDVGVFEVGMGGRWDATNLVRGEVAVLNVVDVDHAELGATALDVAREKVGIIKPGARVVSARQRPEVADVVAAAAERAGATPWLLGRDLEVRERQVAVGGQLLTLRVGERVIDEVLLPAFGAHQADNAALALGAFAALTGEAFDAMEDDIVRHGLGAVVLPGRLEVVRRDPTVVLDGAHNPHAARAAAAALDESFAFRELVLVAACLSDKDVEGVLAPFRELASHVVVTTVDDPRAADLGHMAAAAERVWDRAGPVVEVADDLGAALSAASSVAREGDGVLVTGSLRLVAAAREHFLPLGDARDEDTVVLGPDDEPDPIETARDAAGVLADDEAFERALAELLDEDDEA